jgi:ubiquinone biosynthesis protein Coq4
METRFLSLRHPLRSLAVLRNFARTVKDPTRSDIQAGINRLIRDALADATPEEERSARAERPEIAALWDERYDPPLDRAALEALPTGTLGREYARFIRDNRIDPLGTLVELGPPRSFLEYAMIRGYKLHDVLHVILGCDASVMGEVRIVAYSLGQGLGARPRAPAAALSVLFLHLTLVDPARLREAVDLAHRWMHLGMRAPGHTGLRIEDWLADPVEEVRARALGPAAIGQAA